MRLRHIVATVVITALVLSGCTSLSLNDSDILSPPNATGSRAEIQRMIEKDAHGSYELIYPSSGTHKSGIIRYDIDHDGADDAIALFVTADKTPRMLIASGNGNGYRLTDSIQISSANVSEVRLVDLNADGKDELILSCDAGSSSSSLTAYIIDSGITQTPIAEGFYSYLIGDFDANASADVLVTYTQESHASKASLMIYENNSFKEKSACDIDNNVVSFAQLQYGTISEDLYGAVIDGKLTDGSYTTQLLYYDAAAKLLVNPLFMNESYSESVRQADLTSRDIDGDGIIEVPVCAAMASAKDEAAEDVCGLVRWCGYEPELMSLSTKLTAALCDKLGFVLELDAGTVNTVTARYTADDTVTFYQLSYNKSNEPVVGKELLTVSRLKKNGPVGDDKTDGALGEDDTYRYSYQAAKGSPFTDEMLNNGFHLLNDSKA